MSSLSIARLPGYDRQVLEVARAHGTRVAAEWSGWSRQSVLMLRKDHDGYSRGRGHPTAAELAAEEPSWGCACQRCVDWRHDQHQAHVELRSKLRSFIDPEDSTWMDQGNCFGADPDLFFPSRGDNHKVRAAKAMCHGCPVPERCLEYALDHGERYGIWGGKSERERRRMQSNWSRSKECAHCGARFEAGHPHEKYCTDECRSTAHQIQKDESRRRSA